MTDIGKKNILLVEDEIITAQVEKKQLEEEGYQVFHVLTGKEAIDTVYSNQLPIDIILMDINLGEGIDGTQAAQKIFKQFDIPIIFLSSHFEKKFIERAEKISSYGYVIKNPNPTVLNTTIKMALKLFETKRNLKDELARRKLAEKEVYKKEEQFKTLFMSIEEGFYLSEIIYDSNGIPCDYRYLEVNPKFEQIIGMSRDKIIGKRYKELVPVDTTDWLETYCRVARTGTPSYYYFYSPEYKMHFETYSYKPSAKQVSVFVRNVTERKLAEEAIQNLLKEKELLLKETHHRVNNNMNMLLGLLTLQVEAQKNPVIKDILNHISNRIQNMVMVYDKLYRLDIRGELNAKEFLPPLIDEIIGLYQSTVSVKKDVYIEDIVISKTVLSPIGIIINELITNSMKHAFTDSQSGIITISLSKNNDAVTMKYEDNGIGMPESLRAENSSGFGLQLIELLVQQIQGSVTVEKNNGTIYTIEFKI